MKLTFNTFPASLITSPNGILKKEKRSIHGVNKEPCYICIGCDAPHLN